MMVWSKGLGKLTLPMQLDKATVKVGRDHLAMEGMIEPVFWQYQLRVYPGDLADFMKILADRRTVMSLATEHGILIPFLLRLAAFIPKVSVKILIARTWGRLRGRNES